MNKSAAFALIGIGALLIVLAIVIHFVVTVKIVPHFSIIVGILGLIAIGLGGYSTTTAKS